MYLSSISSKKYIVCIYIWKLVIGLKYDLHGFNLDPKSSLTNSPKARLCSTRFSPPKKRRTHPFRAARFPVVWNDEFSSCLYVNGSTLQAFCVAHAPCAPSISLPRKKPARKPRIVHFFTTLTLGCPARKSKFRNCIFFF